jgi:hypothetical protein
MATAIPKTLILKPGILVNLNTSVTGGVSYDREDLDDWTEEDGTEVAKWQTTRRMDDAEEHKAAANARTRCYRLIRNVCTKTKNHGLLCPTAKEEQLNEAIAEARKTAEEFNETASHSYVDFTIMKGRISETDEEATRALATEIRGLLNEIDEGIRGLDPKLIRDAWKRARQMGQMIDNGQAKRVTAAAEAAREAANEIAKRVVRGGEKGEKVVADLKLEAIRKARFAFLDTGKALKVKRLPTVRAQRFADIKSAPKKEAK